MQTHWADSFEKVRKPDWGVFELNKIHHIGKRMHVDFIFFRPPLSAGFPISSVLGHVVS